VLLDKLHLKLGLGLDGLTVLHRKSRYRLNAEYNFPDYVRGRSLNNHSSLASHGSPVSSFDCARILFQGLGRRQAAEHHILTRSRLARCKIETAF